MANRREDLPESEKVAIKSEFYDLIQENHDIFMKGLKLIRSNFKAGRIA